MGRLRNVTNAGRGGRRQREQNWRPFGSARRGPSTANMRPRRRLSASVPQPSRGEQRWAIARTFRACSTGGESATGFRTISDVGRMVTADPCAASGAGSSIVSVGFWPSSGLVTVCPMPDVPTPGVSRAAVSRAASRPMDPSACRTSASRAASSSHGCAAVSGSFSRMNAWASSSLKRSSSMRQVIRLCASELPGCSGTSQKDERPTKTTGGICSGIMFDTSRRYCRASGRSQFRIIDDDRTPLAVVSVGGQCVEHRLHVIRLKLRLRLVQKLADDAAGTDAVDSRRARCETRSRTG